MTISVYNYIDYREYLKDVFKMMKKKHSYFSHRYLCRMLGLRSSGHFLLIIQGRRNLNHDHLIKLAEILKLDKGETVYLENIVGYCQAKSYQEKNLYWTKIVEIRAAKNKDKNIEEKQYEFFNNWYNGVILECIEFLDYPVDYKQLAKLIDPPITAKKAKESVRLLLDLGFLIEIENGFERKYPVLTTEEILWELGIHNFCMKMSDFAIRAFEKYRYPDCSKSSILFKSTDAGLKELDNTIKIFRRKVVRLLTDAEDITKPNRVCLLNLQIFPLTHYLPAKNQETPKND